MNRTVRAATVVFCHAAAATATPAPGENLRVLDFWQIYSDAPNALCKEIAADAIKRLNEQPGEGTAEDEALRAVSSSAGRATSRRP